MTPNAATVISIRRIDDARVVLLRELHSELLIELRQVEKDLNAITVHDVRVAARKIRALLRSMRREANPMLYAQLRFDLTNLGREFAEVRNADAELRLVDTLLGDDARVNLKDRAVLTTLLERRTTSARRLLVRHMQSEQWRQRLARIATLIEDDDLLLIPAQPIKKELTATLYASVTETLAAIDKRSNSIAGLHRLRIRVKSTRYVCESLTAALKMDTRRTIDALSKAQDTLGELHDLCAFVDWLPSVPIPDPLLKQLVQAADTDMNAYRKRYQRLRPEVHKRLRKLAKTLSVH